MNGILVLVIMVLIVGFFLIGFMLGVGEGLTLQNESTYHDCDDHLVFDEGKPNHAFKCRICNKKY